MNASTPWANNMNNRFSQVITTSRKHFLNRKMLHFCKAKTILYSQSNNVDTDISRIDIEMVEAIQLLIYVCNPIVGQVHQICCSLWRDQYSHSQIYHITVKYKSTIAIMLNWFYWINNQIFTNEPGRESLATLFIYVWIYISSIISKASFAFHGYKSQTAQSS